MDRITNAKLFLAIEASVASIIKRDFICYIVYTDNKKHIKRDYNKARCLRERQEKSYKKKNQLFARF